MNFQLPPFITYTLHGSTTERESSYDVRVVSRDNPPMRGGKRLSPFRARKRLERRKRAKQTRKRQRDRKRNI